MDGVEKFFSFPSIRPITISRDNNGEALESLADFLEKDMLVAFGTSIKNDTVDIKHISGIDKNKGIICSLYDAHLTLGKGVFGSDIISTESYRDGSVSKLSDYESQIMPIGIITGDFANYLNKSASKIKTGYVNHMTLPTMIGELFYGNPFRILANDSYSKRKVAIETLKEVPKNLASKSGISINHHHPHHV